MADVLTAAAQAELTPDGVIARLREGNDRFASGRATDRDLLAQAAATAADGQHPMAAILGCVDSRVPVERVFDLGIGDAFVARTAGNVAGGDVLGSLEFAAKLAGVPVIVVLGHTGCGAVKGACDGVELGELTGLLAKIRPAVQAASGGDGTPGSDDPALVQRAVEANVDLVVDQLTASSDVLRDLVGSDDLTIVGAVYDLSTGRVTWRHR